MDGRCQGERYCGLGWFAFWLRIEQVANEDLARQIHEALERELECRNSSCDRLIDQSADESYVPQFWNRAYGVSGFFLSSIFFCGLMQGGVLLRNAMYPIFGSVHPTYEACMTGKQEGGKALNGLHRC